MKKNVIVTSANKRDGEFLTKHWLTSLKDNVNLSDIDIIIIDYGMDTKSLQKLKSTKVIIFKGNKVGHLLTQRFVDAGKYLLQKNYDQVLFTDGGDIVFQEDISNLFKENKDIFRAVPIDMDVLFFEYFIPSNFHKILAKEMYGFLKDKPVINAGFILAPKNKFVNLCSEIERLVGRNDRYGPDQVVLNYYIYRDKVKFLDKKYNFMVNTVKEGFILKEGVFYKKNGEKIAVVHNAGHNGLLRPISNFGYGKEFNQIKHIVYSLKRFYYANIVRLKGIIKHRV